MLEEENSKKIQSLLKQIDIEPFFSYKNSKRDLCVNQEEFSGEFIIISKHSGSYQQQKPLQAYIDLPLNPDLVYNLKVQFDRTSQVGSRFQIGLIPIDKINTSEDLSYFQMCYDNENISGGIDQVIQGIQLQEEKWEGSSKTFEMEIYLRGKVLNIQDSPFNKNKQVISDQSRINPYEKYMIAFNFEGLNSGIKIFEFSASQSNEQNRKSARQIKQFDSQFQYPIPALEQIKIKNYYNQ